MSVSEEARHERYPALEKAHGRARATTLREMLAPVGWADVATRRDLDHPEQRMELRFRRVDDRFDAMRHRLGPVVASLTGQPWKVFAMLVGLQLTAAGVIVAFQRLP